MDSIVKRGGCVSCRRLLYRCIDGTRILQHRPTCRRCDIPYPVPGTYHTTIAGVVHVEGERGPAVAQESARNNGGLLETEGMLSLIQERFKLGEVAVKAIRAIRKPQL